MQKKMVLSAMVVSLLFCALQVFAQESGDVAINEKTGFPEIENTPYVVFQEGITGCIGNRVIKQDSRSNFVWQDYMAGAFFGIKTRNMQPIDSTIRLSLFYPLATNFNQVPQVIKNVIRFNADLYMAPMIEFNMWEYVRFNAALGLDINVQSTDRFLYVNLGPGLLVGMELPISKKWTIQLDGLACYDFGDFGNNRNIEPVDHSFRYQLSLGCRFSSVDLNTYSYIK